MSGWESSILICPICKNYLEQNMSEYSEYIKILKKINNLFLGMGFDEIITSSFVSDAMYKEFLIEYDNQKTVKGLNACSEENTMLRQSTIPSIMQTIKYNHDNGQKNLWVYEFAKTLYFKKDERGGIRYFL